MNKINKFISMIFICLSIIGISNFSAIDVKADTKADTKPVELCYADFHDTYPDGYAAGGGYVYGLVKVKNLAYDKKVIIHYTYYKNYDWKDVEAKYYKTDNEGNEIWRFEAPSVFFLDCNFAIKCEMNGQTYWDNNGGKNYLVARDKDAYGTDAINVQYFKCKVTDDNKIEHFNGYAFVNNIGYEKDIKVRYTTDNWKTYKEKKAEYRENWPGKYFDIWNFSVDLDEPAENVQFAVVYKVNGQEYWDNNYGSNYDVRNWQDRSRYYR